MEGESFPRSAGFEVIQQYYTTQLNQIRSGSVPSVVVELIAQYAEEQFYVGQLVDFLDVVSRWCVGQVAEIDYPRSMVCIHSVGWSDKWNELVSFDSNRIAEFRTHTKGDTGPQRTPAEPNSESLTMLNKMGFPLEQASRALVMYGNNFDQALNFLFRTRFYKPNQFLC
eukprot:TRINITY_DN4600_c0_g1_i1.p1 TRINITY_DN4600_c0_g1~~TRINITY_DN4600_c0_g1_i1.p1  ORF type:complete len:169 (-),score=23.19 TRINITY_DN4600_c0_g1_i1:254-760(-)